MTTNDLEITRMCGQIDMLPGSDFPSTRKMLNQLDPSNPGSRNDDDDAPACSERLIWYSTLGGARPDLSQSESILATKRRIFIHSSMNYKSIICTREGNGVKSWRTEDTYWMRV